MNDHDALLEAILENPGDDAPRLAFADWLEEHEEPPRAEFIRLQCEQGPVVNDGPHARERRFRIRDLLKLYGEDWASPVVGRGVQRVRFRRGFIEEVKATTHAFITRGAAWAAATPLREARLTGVAGRGDRLAVCRHLASLAGLNLADRQAGDRDFMAIAQSRHLSGLTTFCIQGDFSGGVGAQIGDVGLCSLAEAPFLPALVSLCVTSDGSIGSTGVKALAESSSTAQ